MVLLAEAGALELEVVGRSQRRLAAHPNVTIIDVESPDHAPRRIVVDLTDAPALADPSLAPEAASILKRTTALGKPYPQSVQPLGPVFPCRAGGRLWRRLRVAYARRRGGLLSSTQIRRIAAQLRASPPRLLADLEAAPSIDVEPSVIFQPRLWTRNETTAPELDEINEQRIALVRALRDELGQRFIGGLVPSEEANRRAPELITTAPTDPEGYLALLHRSTISVSSVGLHGSAPWKIGEALAASRIVLTEPLGLDFSGSWRDALHVYNDVDDCVSTCTELLDDPDRCHDLMTRSHLYYRRHVRPDVQLSRHLLSGP